MDSINWGIIGCGDVTEVKSGPAFNKVPHSNLKAVMRRDAVKAKDYAQRHGVSQWYDDANKLINDRAINAVYIATPPSSHLQYAMAVQEAGKMLYVEKPMTATLEEALRLQEISAKPGAKVAIAHYRRQIPYFKKIKELLDEKVIGDPLVTRLDFYTKPLTATELHIPKIAWRVDPAIAGGGLFHDLAPHQLDLMHHFFGPATSVKGVATNQSGLYEAPDYVAGNILFQNGMAFSGTWCFSAPEERDCCEIIGTRGKIECSIFNMKTIRLTTEHRAEIFNFDPLVHVQQPMIEQVVQYFLGKAPNPCSAADGALIMQWMDTIVH